MKQLIPQSKIDEASKENASDKWGVLYNDLHPDAVNDLTNGEISIQDFNSGVQFALTEIKPIMIEFAEWLLAYDRNSEGMWFSPFSSSSNNPKFTTKQLLEQFLKTKTEWN